MFFEEAEIQVSMTWWVTHADEHSITLQLNFTNPLAVSTDLYSYDELAFNKFNVQCARYRKRKEQGGLD